MDIMAYIGTINWEPVIVALITGAASAYTFARRMTMAEFEGWVNEFNEASSDNKFEIKEYASLFTRLVRIFKD